MILHEVAHGAVAYSLGDPTAKYEGRLTLNPVSHIDPFGSIFLPLIMLITSLQFGKVLIFGYAKPVPINPHNFKDKKWGELKVAISGPASNFLIALMFGILMRFLGPANILFYYFKIIVELNLMLMIFNLIPIPPLDGHWILFSLLPRGFENFKNILSQYGMFILLFIVFFAFNWVINITSFLFSLITGYGFY